MADKNFAVSLLIGAKDRASRVVNRLNNALSSLNSTALGVGATLAGAFGLYTVGRFFTSAIDSARGFQAQMSRVQAATGATAAEMRELEAAASAMGASTRYTATQAAQGLEILGRAGLSAAESVKALPTVLQLAQADGMDLATAAGIVTDSLGAMGQGVEEAGRFADVLAQGARLANTDVSNLGAALSYAGVQASQAGMSVEETVAVLDALANAGIRGERAGTSLRGILSQLADPASKARDELRKLGIDTADLGDVIRGLERAGASGEAAVLAFGTEAGPALRTLLQTGTAGLTEYQAALEASEGTALDMARAMDSNLDGAIRGLSSAWDALTKRMVKPLLKPITEEVRALTEWMREFAGSEALKNFSRGLVQAFKDGAQAVRDFAASFDFRRALDEITAFTVQAGAQLGTVARVLQAALGGVRIFVNGLTSSVKLVGAVLAETAAGAMWYAGKLARAMNKIGVVSDETVRNMDLLYESLHDLSARYVAAIAEDGEDIKAGWRALTGTVGEYEQKVRDAAKAAQEAAEKQKQAMAQVPEALVPATKAYENLVAQIKAATDTSELARASESLTALYQAGALRAGEYEAVQARLAQRSLELAGNTEAAADALNQAGITFGYTALSAEQLEEKLASINDQLRAATSEKQAHALGVELRQMFIEGRISAEQFDAEMAKVQARIEELEEVTGDTASGFDDLAKAIDRASTAKEFEALREKLRDAYQAGEISGEKYRALLAQLRKEQKQLNEETDRTATTVAGAFDGLGQDAAAAGEQVRALGEEDLAGLRAGIDAANAGLDGMSRRADAIRDELDRLRGNEEAIEQRRYEAQVAELRQAAQEASQRGDAAALADAREALRLARELHRERMDNLQAEAAERQRQDKAAPAQPAAAQAAQPAAPAQAPGRTVRVELAAPDGRQVALTADSDEDAQRMIELLQQARSRSA